MSTPVWQAPEPDPGPAPGMSFASPGSRLIAYILDGVIQFLIVAVLAILAIALGAIFFVLGVIPAIAIIVVSLEHFPHFWARDGQTPGMNAMKIKVVRDSAGGRTTPGHAIMRVIGFWIGLAGFYAGV